MEIKFNSKIKVKYLFVTEFYSDRQNYIKEQK